MTELRLDGHVAVITGAGRGLGRSHALLLAERGARVVVNDPGVELDGTGGDAAPAEEVVGLITARGGEAVANLDPVGTEKAAATLIEQAMDTYGRIDILVNNAGIFTPMQTFAETTTESFERVLQVHLMGTIHTTRAAWPRMAAGGYGKIVNTVSAVGYVGSPGRLEYGTAKAALHGFTRGLAVGSLDDGIYVNALSPGARTRPVTESTPDEFPEEIARAFGPELVSPTVLWLVHPDTRVNGEVFTSIAGTTAQVVIGESYGFGSDKPTAEQIRDNVGRVFLSDSVVAAGLVRHFDADHQGLTVISRFGHRGERPPPADQTPDQASTDQASTVDMSA
jgi:NAD(P)-dependent dehydrogenase (short-subunit alcohol dehydrogenase family)